MFLTANAVGKYNLPTFKWREGAKASLTVVRKYGIRGKVIPIKEGTFTVGYTVLVW